MDLKDILGLLQTASIILTMLVAMGTLRGRKDDQVVNLTEMKSDIKYIKGQVEGLSDLPDRVTRVEESAKSAHKRLDEHIRSDH